MKKNVSMLFIYCNHNFGGAERRLIRIYNELGKNHNVQLFVRGCKKKEFIMQSKKSDCAINKFSKIICCRSNLKCLFYLIFANFGNIHFFDLCGFNMLIAYLMKFRKISTLLTIAYQNYAYGLIDDSVKRKLAKLLNKVDKIDVLFPVGKTYLSQISQNKNITVTPGTFTDLDKFVPGEKEKILLFAAARLEKDKNAELLIEACKLCECHLREKNYKVIIAGKDYEEKNLKKKIEEYQIQDIVEMPGYIKISDVFSSIELFCCLDLIDNYPSQTIAEASACGCALVCTDVGESRKCGSEQFVFYIHNDKYELSEIIKEYIYKSNIEKKGIAKAARYYAEEHYCVEKSRKYFENLIWGD